MDKQEYKIRSEEIKALAEEKNYREASDIADTIDWRRVKSVKMLCTISDIYKMVRRYEDSKTILEMAYEKRPGSRMIVYALTELCLKLGDIVNAWEYYKEFCQIAPDDTRRYILLYKVYAAQEVSLEEQIKVLEKLKEEEYIDRWAYELAYLYHKIGFGTKCVEECDEMILWFGEGRYVRKAMELKMLHEPLTAKQQAIYNGEKRQEIESGDTRVIPDLDAAIVKENEGKDVTDAPTIKLPTEEVADIQVKILDDSPYNTINLQKELAEGVVELMQGETAEPIWQGTDPVIPDGQNRGTVYGQEMQTDVFYNQEMVPYDEDEEEVITNTGEMFLEEDPGEEDDDSPNARITRSLMAPMLEETQEIPPISEREEVFFEDPNTVDLTDAMMKLDAGIPEKETGRRNNAVSDIASNMISNMASNMPSNVAAIEAVASVGAGIPAEKAGNRLFPERKPQDENRPAYEEEGTVSGGKKVTVSAPSEHDALKMPGDMMQPTDFATQKSGFDEILSQEADGQISLVVPEKEKVEKQITGQMNLQDILQEWEQVKKNQETQLKNDVKKRVLDRTGELFADFDANKDELIKKLERASKVAEAREAEKAAEKEAEEPEVREEELPAEVYPEETEQLEEAETLENEDYDSSNAGENEEETAIKEEAVRKEVPKKEDIKQEPIKKEPVKKEPVKKEGIKKEVARIRLPEELRPIKNDRPLSPEEKELFDAYVQSRKSKEQLLNVLDNMSLAAYTGNVLITGEEAAGAMNFARNLVQDIQMTDRNFSGKAAKITGKALNKKDPEDIINKLSNGALIVVEAGGMNCSAAEALVSALQTESKGIIVMLVDTKGAINSLLDVNDVLRDPFNTRIDIEALNDDALVAYGKKFAYEKEYAIDEMGGLALHTRIADMQTAEHSVTVAEVRGLVKQAIRHANRKTPKHFFELLLGKRYDKEDMIVLREEDFFYYESKRALS